MKPDKRCRLTVKNMTRHQQIPSHYYFKRWTQLALGNPSGANEIHIRMVDEKEIASLNKIYRGKSGATNILSFPFEAPPGIKTDLLGDLVICVPVIMREAREQKKELLAHWAHMVIHGTLHLLGYDHIRKKDAVIMETIEIKLLKKLGYPNPYLF